MKNKNSAQFTFDELFVSPFTRQRSFDPKTLDNFLVTVVPKRTRSGVKVLDEVIDVLVENNSRLGEARTADELSTEFYRVARRNGMKFSELSKIVQGLTGLTIGGFSIAWRARLADWLLRYTDLDVGIVMRASGFISPTAFSRFVRLHCGQPPRRYRLEGRRPGDIGKYAL